MFKFFFSPFIVVFCLYVASLSIMKKSNVQGRWNNIISACCMFYIWRGWNTLTQWYVLLLWCRSDPGDCWRPGPESGWDPSSSQEGGTLHFHVWLMTDVITEVVDPLKHRLDVWAEGHRGCCTCWDVPWRADWLISVPHVALQRQRPAGDYLLWMFLWMNK